MVPSPNGVRIEVVATVADQLVAANTNAEELAVLGADGTPFLRISSGGVFANVTATDWYLSNNPSGRGVVPERARQGLPPEWALVSREASWGWFDHRLHPSEVTPAGLRWEVPMRFGERDLVARGHREQVSVPTARVVTVEQSPIDGLSVTVLQGRVPALNVTWDGRGTLTFLGESGEPFARVAPTGAEVNEASPTWALTASANAGESPSGVVGGAAPPRWRRHSDRPSLTWLEPRAEEPVWAVPVVLDDQRHELRGRTEAVTDAATRRPYEYGNRRRSWFPLVLGASLVVIAAGAILFARGTILRSPSRRPPA